MLSRMMKVVNTTDSLYLNPQQQGQVAEYAKSLPQRFAAARAVEAAETRLVEKALAAFAAARPDVGDPAAAGWESAGDDLRLTLRAVVQGMLLDAPEAAEATALGSIRRTLGYLDFDPAAAADLFAALRAACQEALPPAAAALLAPYLEPAVRPEPAAA